MNEINESQRKFAINFILYIIAFCFLCFIGISKSYADTYTVIGDKADITVVLVSTAYGDQPFNVPKNSGYNFNQVLQIDYLVNNYQFEANKHYQLESHLTAQQLTNANYYSVSGLNGEACLISYTHSVFTGTYPRWDFQCPHATTSITLTIGNNSGQYLWNNSGIYTWTSALLSYSNTPLPSGSSDTDTIINNQNQNTQNIINNQNQNTQNIINNQNQNTQQQIESQKVCTTTLISSDDVILNNSIISNSGAVVTNENSYSDIGVTDYIDVENATNFKALAGAPTGSSVSYYACTYDTNKTRIACYSKTQYINIDISNNVKYIRFTINSVSDMPQFEFTKCKNGNQAIDDSINGLTGALTDDSPINIDSLGNTAGWLPAGPIDSIINLPLNLFNNLLTALNGTCQPINIPLPYVNRNLPIPCISTIFNQIEGLPNFWNWVGVITSVVILYRYLLALYKYYDDLTTMKANFISDFGGAP